MAPHFQLDDRLIRQGQVVGKHRIKKAAVTQAPTDSRRPLRQEKILDLFGKVNFDPAYDYKRQRMRTSKHKKLHGKRP